MTIKIDEDIISSADSAYYTAYGEFLLGNNPVSDIATALQAERNRWTAEIERLQRKIERYVDDYVNLQNDVKRLTRERDEALHSVTGFQTYAAEKSNQYIRACRELDEANEALTVAYLKGVADGKDADKFLVAVANRERDEARNKALDEAANTAEMVQLFDGDFLKNSDPRATIAEAILALKTKEKTDDQTSK